ncbi:hypothetical protein IH781_00310 [Patescibacteria group bacterium]|nr:hypothetical protein [Patescibacteria group bacterium]
MTYAPAVLRTVGNTTYQTVADEGASSTMYAMLDEIRAMRMDMAQVDGAAIVDGCGSLRRATVSSSGALSVGPAQFDETASQTMAVDDQAYNFFNPSPNDKFVITGVLAFAARDISDSSDTIITIYEADESNSTTVDKTLLAFGMGRLTNLQLVPLNLLVNDGVYINAKTTDNTVTMTLLGYKISVSGGL